jgi:hypothetical protein
LCHKLKFYVNLVDFNKKIDFYRSFLCCSFFPSFGFLWSGWLFLVEFPRFTVAPAVFGHAPDFHGRSGFGRAKDSHGFRSFSSVLRVPAQEQVRRPVFPLSCSLQGDPPPVLFRPPLPGCVPVVVFLGSPAKSRAQLLRGSSHSSFSFFQ